MDPDVLVVGESLVDIVRRPDGQVEEFAGGSAANVAVALARLGRPVRFATSFADDEYGAMIAAHLAEAGVVLASDPAAIARTATAVATLAADGSASYQFDLEWRLALRPSPQAPLAVHTSSWAAVVLPGADDVLSLLTGSRETSTISYDINARPTVTGTGPEVVARIEQLVAVSDLVKASDEDLATLYPGTAELDVARRFLAQGPVAVVITRGGAGAVWVDARGAHEVPARPVPVADTIGAGDTFGAALLDALWQRGRLGAAARAELAALPESEITEVLSFAARAAAVTVSRPGADPPYRHELA